MVQVTNLRCSLAAVGFCVALSAAAPISAQDTTESTASDTPPVVEKLFKCRSIADPTERLACYDREVALVEEAASSEELVITDREQVREARKGLFGFTLPKIKLFSGGDDKSEDIKSIKDVVVSSGRTRNGKYRFTLKESGTWVQTDSTSIPSGVDPGDEVTITKAALGSYKAKIRRNRAFRVARQK